MIENYYRSESPNGDWDCSESNRLFQALISMKNRIASKGKLAQLLAQIPDIRAFLTNVNMNPNISCNQLSNFEIIESWNNNNPSGLWDALYAENGSDADWLDWAIQYHLASFLQFNSINQRSYITQYQQNHYLYDSTGNGMENYFTHIGNTYGNVFYNEFYNLSKAYVDSFNLKEWSLYGSARLGIHNTNKVMAWQRVYGNDSNGTLTQPIVTRFVDASNPTTTFYEIVRGNKQYELTNHLGNVLVTVSDKRAAICNGNNFIEYRAEVLTATDYSPFGAPLPGRTFNAQKVPKKVLLNDSFTSTTSGWWYAGATMQLDNGRLKVNTISGASRVFSRVQNTIPLKWYKYTVTVDIGNTSGIRLYAKKQNSSNPADELASMTITASGTYTLWFMAQGTFTDIHAEVSPFPQAGKYFWIDNALVEEDLGINSMSKYRFGFNGMEMDNEIYGNGNEYDYGARIYDPRLGRWMSVEPLQKKYPWLSTYCYANNDPVLFVDVDGKDWFVNNKTGQVVYIKDASSVSAKHIDMIGGSPNDYERLGPNQMFGEKVIIAGSDMLKQDIAIIEASELFMSTRGYAKAEKVNIIEKDALTKAGEDEVPMQTFDEIGDSKTTYVKPEKLDTKQNLQISEYSDENVDVTTYTYKLVKPFGQDSRQTAILPQNRPSESIWSFVKQAVSMLADAYSNKKPTGTRAPSQPSQQKPAGR